MHRVCKACNYNGNILTVHSVAVCALGPTNCKLTNSGSRISQRGAPTLGSVNLLFGIIFGENCMQMKKIGLRGEQASLATLDPPLLSD